MQFVQFFLLTLSEHVKPFFILFQSTRHSMSKTRMLEGPLDHSYSPTFGKPFPSSGIPFCDALSLGCSPRIAICDFLPFHPMQDAAISFETQLPCFPFAPMFDGQHFLTNQTLWVFWAVLVVTSPPCQFHRLAALPLQVAGFEGLFYLLLP